MIYFLGAVPWLVILFSIDNNRHLGLSALYMHCVLRQNKTQVVWRPRKRVSLVKQYNTVYLYKLFILYLHLQLHACKSLLYILYFLYFTAYMYTIQYIYVQVHQRVVNGVHATASSGSKCIFYSAEILAKA